MLYCGNESLSFGNGMMALSISALWTTEPAAKSGRANLAMARHQLRRIEADLDV